MGIDAKMKFFLVLAISSLCSSAPQSGFLPGVPLDGHFIGQPLVADLWSSEIFDPISVEVDDDSSEEVVVPLTLEQARVRLMRYMRELEREIEEDIFENDFLDVQSSLYKLNTRVWPKMIELSDKIYDNLLLADDVKALEREHKVRLGLKRDVARIRFKTGARKCPSPDESFFAPTKRCVLVESSDVDLNPCASKKDMLLYDGIDNKAICDCVQDDRNLIFSEIDGRCHRQNEQGPCQNGTWLVISAEGNVVCEQVPDNCTADGEHVYWSPDPLVAKAQCVQLSVRGSCAEGNLLQRNRSGGVACASPPRPQPLVKLHTSCPPGSYRGQKHQCPV